MAIRENESGKQLQVLSQIPQVTIFLRPIAPPAALGLAGFAGSTWITSSWIAGWWGSPDSPTIFFPFVAFWGGLAQFIAGLHSFHARDVLANVIHCLWGSFWMSIGLLYLLVATGVLPAHSIYTHFPELAAWLAVLAVFTWSCAFASLARDAILASVLFSLAIGTTIACCLFATGTGVHVGIVVAAYFWMLSALLAWWRVTVYLVEEAYGPDSVVTKFFPIFRTRLEKRAPLVMPGLGEPGVKRGVPKLVAANFGHDDITDAQGYTKGSATAAPIDVSTNGTNA